jgi:hypothetical protein
LWLRGDPHLSRQQLKAAGSLRRAGYDVAFSDPFVLDRSRFDALRHRARL